MESAIEKADTLLEALGWIREFRDKITVIKLGGSVMENESALKDVLHDIVFMEAVGMRPVVVHGGGAAISTAMKEAGIESQFIHGRRYTDQATLDIVEKVLATDINNRLADIIESLGGRAMNLNFQSTNVLTGESIKLDSDAGPVDLGYVGRVTNVDRSVVENLCYAGQVPVIPSMCVDAQGQKLNVNADTAATAVAQSLGAEKLVFLSDIQGVLRNPEDPSSLIHSMTEREAMQLIRDGIVVGGMIPKIEACVESLGRGVGKVHIIDGRVRHSLMLEVYTTSGVGTQITRSDPES